MGALDSSFFCHFDQKLSHDRLLHDHVFWDYFWDAYRDREPARTDNSVWEIEKAYKHLHIIDKHTKQSSFVYVCPIYKILFPIIITRNDVIVITHKRTYL